MKFLIAFAALSSTLFTAPLQAGPAVNRVNNLGNGYYNVWWLDIVKNESGTTCYEAKASNNNGSGCWQQGTITCRTSGELLMGFSMLDEVGASSQPFMRFTYQRNTPKARSVDYCDVFTTEEEGTPNYILEFTDQKEQDRLQAEPHWLLVNQVISDILRYYFLGKKPLVPNKWLDCSYQSEKGLGGEPRRWHHSGHKR